MIMIIVFVVVQCISLNITTIFMYHRTFLLRLLFILVNYTFIVFVFVERYGIVVVEFTENVVSVDLFLGWLV